MSPRCAPHVRDLPPCELCGVRDAADLLTSNGRQILCCRRCGLVFSDRRDSSNQCSAAYSEAYYRDGVYANYLGDRAAIERNARRVLLELQTLTAGRRLLDVGCAAGFFLAAARQAGWTVQGCELSEYMAGYARREFALPVIVGSIEVPSSDFSRYDVVTMWDTVEHLVHPVRALTAIRDLMDPGGYLVLSTGDYESILARIAGKRWRLLADPTHNFFFTATTLERLLEKTGFRLESVKRKGKWVTLAMILHQSRLPFAIPIRHFLEHRGWNPALYVNPRDVMTVVARAKS